MLFSDVVGQQGIKDLFLHAATEGRLPHALLFRGPAGVGKLPLVLAAAQYLTCHNPTTTDSCGVCPSCSKMHQGIHPDVHFVAPIFLHTVGGKTQTTDEFITQFRTTVLAKPYIGLNDWGAALDAENKQLVISISEIRELKKKMQLTAYEGQKKIIVIWHAEKINNEGANAFLKLLEEPPEDTHILLTLEEPAQLLPTIISRCQTLRVAPLALTDIENYLIHAENIAPEKAFEIAGIADGNLSEALTNIHHAEDGMLDRFKQWMRLSYDGKFTTIHSWTEEITQLTKETQKLFLSFALKKFRDALVMQARVPELVHVRDDEFKFLENFSKTLGIQGVEKASDLIETNLKYLNRNANPSLTWIQLSLQLHQIFKSERNRIAAK